MLGVGKLVVRQVEFSIQPAGPVQTQAPPPAPIPAPVPE